MKLHLHLPTLLCCLALLLGTVLHADDRVLRETLSLGLPVICVETVNHEFPSFDRIDPPDGCWGIGITNATKVPGRLTMYATDGTVTYESGEYQKNASGMTIKVRGNTSAFWLKRPFKIKLQKKADLLLRDDKRYEDKDWLLIRDLGINTFEGFKVGELLGMEYVPASQYVNVIFNGEYYGLYLLCEAVERGKECRIGADEETGFIVELDPYFWKEDGYIKSSFTEPMNWTFKYPEYEDLTPARLNSVADYLGRMESSLADNTYTDYLDVTTMAKWLWGHEMLGNADGSGANPYFCKYDDRETSRLKMPVLWDFGNIRKANGWAGMHNLHFFKKFFSNGDDDTFKQTFVECWDEMKERVFDGLTAAISEFATSNLGQAYDRSFAVDYEKWHRYFPLDSLHVDKMAERDIDYYRQRKAWIENAIAPLRGQTEPDTTSNVLKREQLRILDIGNSYTLDTTDLLPDIVAASGTDVSSVSLWTLVRSYGSFRSWCDCYEDKDTRDYFLTRRLGGLDVGLTNTMGLAGDGSAMRDALTKVKWDLIIIHPVSTAAPYKDLWTGDGESGGLDELLAIIHKHQPQAAIGFYIVHSSWSGYANNKERSSYLRWQLIANAVSELQQEGKADLIIPYGTAIENLRCSSLNNDYDLTRDGLHLCYGLAQYAAACCYYEAVFAPRSGISVMGNTARVDCTGMETRYPAISVNDSNAAFAQKAAILAMKYPYNCTDPETTVIDSATMANSNNDTYNLSGIRILPRQQRKGSYTKKGVYIRNGRKVISGM